ncbi:MAG: GNAT family N-acetyltransferase [Microvirga sp.]
MTIRRAGSRDIPVLAGIAERSYRSAFADILEPAILEGRNASFFEGLFRESLERLTLAESLGAPVGFLVVTDGHVDMLFVDPEAFGHGVGSALLAHAEASGATSLECFADNHPARRFYTRNGWLLTRTYERVFAGRLRGFVRFEKGGAGSPPRSG